MNTLFKLILLICIQVFALSDSKAQVQQGVVFKKGTAIRVGSVRVQNMNSGFTIITDKLGIFSISASTGDTLQFSHSDYSEQKVVVSDFKDVFVYLQPVNVLSEVIIKGESVKQNLKEVEDSYRSKGIYYKGKPPITSLIHPVTFFNEIFSKNGKRARRFNKYAERESEYYEIAARFNDRTIKSIIPAVGDEDLIAFKAAFWPTAEQIRSWNDFSLLSYIKKSYAEFLKSKNIK